MEFSLAGEGGHTYTIHTEEVKDFSQDLVKTIIEMDLMTFSEPTWSRTTARTLLRMGRTFLLMADDLVIGSCHFLRSWERRNEAVLVTMAIRPGWRGRGLGTRFLDGVFDGLRREGLRSVVLEVEDSNHAGIAVYERKFGFRIVGRTEGAGRGRRDVLMLRMVLSEQPLGQVAEFPGGE